MNAPHIDLVYFPGCPNVDTARETLRAALLAENLPPQWREWNRNDAATPAALRGLASPTILIGGRDVAPAESDAQACRVYPHESGLSGAPDTTAIRAAISEYRNAQD